MKTAILAAGTWGTALANTLAKNHSVTVWSAIPEEISTLSETRRHRNLPGMTISDSISFTTDMRQAVSDAKIIINATPSVYVRQTMNELRNHITPGQIIVCVTKGIEPGTLFSMSEVITDVISDAASVVALSGPTHAEEVAVGIPTLIVSASADEKAAATVQSLFSGTCIRPYTNFDIKGVELCGALKNIIAIACGIARGFGCGDNTSAAIITRGLSEITNLGLLMGCKRETFAGLAGIGDLIVTATSMHSRNNRCGTYIGEGMSPEDAVKKTGMVVEGINALPAAMKLKEKYHADMPIISAVNEIINGNKKVSDVIEKLFSRSLKAEIRTDDNGLRFEKEIITRPI